MSVLSLSSNLPQTLLTNVGSIFQQLLDEGKVRVYEAERRIAH